MRVSLTHKPMKKLIYSMGFIALFGMIACSNPSKKIQGNWVVEDAKLTLSKESQNDSNMMMIAGMMEGIIKQMKGNATIEFTKDGKMTRVFGGQPETGTWKISDDGKKLISGMPGSPKKDTALLEFNGDDKINLTNHSKEADFVLVLKRSKSK
ncbi:MAG: hypothetical protein RLZZ161_180 [Bacteroidota bacterium]|jgi:hypothetical protein